MGYKFGGRWRVRTEPVDGITHGALRDGGERDAQGGALGDEHDQEEQLSEARHAEGA